MYWEDYYRRHHSTVGDPEITTTKVREVQSRKAKEPMYVTDEGREGVA